MAFHIRQVLASPLENPTELRKYIWQIKVFDFDFTFLLKKDFFVYSAATYVSKALARRSYPYTEEYQTV